MLQKNAHEISASEVPMVKSYGMLKLGYLHGDNVRNPFLTIKSGYFLTLCDDMVCHKVKDLTRTFRIMSYDLVDHRWCSGTTVAMSCSSCLLTFLVQYFRLSKAKPAAPSSVPLSLDG